MAIVIDGNNTPTAGGIGYGDGTELAFTAAGTSGRPIVSGGAGAPTFRPYTLPAADGSANQILQTDGSGALSFATPNTGAMTLLANINATSGAYATFDGYFTSDYDVYLVTASNFTPSGGSGNVRSQIAVASSFKTDAFYKQAEIVIGNNATTITGYAQTTADRVDMTTGGAIATNGGLTCYIYNPLNTDGAKVISFSIYGTDGSGVLRQSLGTFSYSNSTAAISGIRFYSVGGDWVAGTFQLFGLKKS
jgi:hypothetical protein